MIRKKHHILNCIVLIVVMFLVFSCTWWKGVWGDHPLGNHLSLLEGDRKEDRIIVYCPNDNENVCHSGIYVVPTYKRHYDSDTQNYAEYVEAALSNEKWVIVKTVQIKEKKENYWIVSKKFNIENQDCTTKNCDSILQSHVTGPLSLPIFKNKVRILKIDLEF
jgi:hypothetical protein